MRDEERERERERKREEEGKRIISDKESFVIKALP